MSTAIGRQAEQVAADWLRSRGYKILTQNWRTRHCEIDIIASKNKVVYMVEVKYRVHTQSGSGLEYITPSKLKQMEFAAAIWVNETNWENDYCLSALEITGKDFKVTDFISCL